MLVLVGYVMVLGAVFGGYSLAGGHMGAMYQPLELLIIGGAALGAFVIGSPSKTIKSTFKVLPTLLQGSKYTKALYMELMALLYEILDKTRKDLLDLAKARPGRTMDGVSLMPAARNPAKVPNRAIEIEALAPLFEGDIPNNAWDRPYKGVRTNRYTYVVYKETGDEELYDRQLDPYELQSVADQPAYAAVKAHLAAKLARLDDCKGRACDVKP